MIDILTVFLKKHLGARDAEATASVLGDWAAIHRTSKHGAAASALASFALPEQEAFGAQRVMRVFTGESTAAEELAGAFCENAAGAGWAAKRADLLPLVRLAACQSEGLAMNLAFEEAGGMQPAYHAHSCWGFVVDKLESYEGEGIAPELVSTAKELLTDLDDNVGRLHAAPYFEVVLQGWEALGGCTYTFRALMDIVKMSEGWPETPESRLALKDAFATVGAEKGE